LNDLVQSSDELGITITESGLHQRLNDQAVRFMKLLLERSIQRFQDRQRLPGEVLRHFSQVNVLDSSIVTLPETLREQFRGVGWRGGVAAAKLQLSFDYLSGALNALEVTSARTPDQTCQLHRQQACPQSLQLFDLGYFDQQVLADLDHQQAYFISRLQTQTALYPTAEASEALDLRALLPAQLEPCGERQVYLGRLTRLPVRLVFERLPPTVVAARRRTAKLKARKHGQTCSERLLALLEWSLFITNVPADFLTPDQVLIVYRVRWQAELVFKLWKSQAKLKHVPPCKPARVLCQFYARLLAVVLFHWLVAPWRFAHSLELSLPKAFRILQRYASRLLQAMATHWVLMPACLQHLADAFLRFAPKNIRKKAPSTYQLLLSSGA
jgi:hypothetical protein